MAELNIARRHKDVAICLITRLEKHVLELEGKERLSHKDKVAIKHYIKVTGYLIVTEHLNLRRK